MYPQTELLQPFSGKRVLMTIQGKKGAAMSTRSLFNSFLAVVACALIALPAFADSHARIVRLSDVQGSVQIDKNTGLGFENAFLNLPITQGAQLKTLSNGRAEVEFEDGSTLHLAPNSSIDFSALGLSDSGRRISSIDLIDGMAYVNWLGKDDLNLTFSHSRLSVDRAAHFRLDSSAALANLAVFKGDVEVEGPGGKVTVEKKKTATFDAVDNDEYKLSNKIAGGPFDSWDKESIEYHDQYGKNNTGSSPYGYGLSDLNYYGAYSTVPGYGLMWQPYFSGVGWDPFMDGAWGFYPGFGYTFASPYPWGWLPYRYGNWFFLPGMGWMWQPGGWNNWLTVPHYTATKLTTVHALVVPTGTQKTVVVGKGGPAATVVATRLVVNSGSAGMGIPRGSLGNLSHLNHEVAKSGYAQVRPAPQFSASSPRGSWAGPSREGTAAPAPRASSAGHSSGSGTSHH
jgi:FecR protein